MDFFMENILKWLIALIVIVLISANIYLTIYTYNNPKTIKEEPVEIIKEEVEEKEELTLSNYYVDIKGAIAKPGVYEVEAGTIINDVINMAGGLTKNASTKYLNLSKETSKEMVIYIYTNNELKNQNTIKETCTCKNEIIYECVEQKASIIEIKPDQKEEQVDIPSTSNKININTASVEELMTLTGIGESKALAIIEYRNTNGNFQSIEDIKNVSGIGDSAFEKIKDNITV